MTNSIQLDALDAEVQEELQQLNHVETVIVTEAIIPL
jgi:hypothetical protein